MRQIALLGLAVLIFSGSAAAEARLLDWSELHGWADDDHDAARDVFLETCGGLPNGIGNGGFYHPSTFP